MQLDLQMQFRENKKYFDYLKRHSYYFKELNRNKIDYKTFLNDMKIKYKERTTDKISNVIDNIELISSLVETLR